MYNGSLRARLRHPQSQESARIVEIVMGMNIRRKNQFCAAWGLGVGPLPVCVTHGFPLRNLTGGHYFGPHSLKALSCLSFLTK